MTQAIALDAALINPFIQATTDVLGTMAGVPVTLKSKSAQMDYSPCGDISAVIGILGDHGEGMVALSFPLPLASIIVSRLLGMTVEQLSSEDRSDGVGELVNMISGNAKTTLSQSGDNPYKLSLPTIIQGRNHEISSRPKNNPYLVLEFEAEGQSFYLQLSFKRS